MARDNHIDRTLRPQRPNPAAARELTRHERVKLLVLHVMPQVRDKIDARLSRQPAPRRT